jgi:hypothetical protein
MGLLMMLATICGTVLVFILLIFAVWQKMNWLRNFVLGATAIWFAVYIVALLSVSLMSEERVLGLNQPKEFCGFYIDCHLHAAVTNVRKTKTLDDKTANGEFYVVTVKVSSDARRARLGLLTVDAKVFDDENCEFERDLEAESELEEQPPFERQISPTETFEKEIVFDLPTDVMNPRLDIREGYGIDHLIEAFLIGDEDSILHKRNYFNLETQTVNLERQFQVK